jgi:hypothetical protein
MLNGLKTSVAVLVGLLIGLVLAVPMGWFGTRIGADSLVRNVHSALVAVESRQQAMADASLELEPRLRVWGVRADADIYQSLQNERSRLAGEAPLQAKILRVQRLEEVLLRTERLWEQAGKKEKVARDYHWQEHGRIWEKQKRLLVREQMVLVDSVTELNRLLGVWPASVLLGYKTFGALINGTFGDVVGNSAFIVRLSLDWAGYGMRKAAALVGQQDPPEPPKWEKPKAKAHLAYIDAMATPIFLADAPLPEDEYRELQFTRESPEDYADVGVGEDKAVLENRNAPAGYAAPIPTAQKTVDYRSSKK